MALSDYEREILEQMEAEFSSADPRFAEQMRARESAPSRPRVRPRLWAAMVVLLLVGLLLLVVGVSLAYHQVLSLVVGIGGFALMVTGLALPFSQLAKARPPRATGGSSPRPRSSFMDRQRDQWDRRSRR